MLRLFKQSLGLLSAVILCALLLFPPVAVHAQFNDEGAFYRNHIQFYDSTAANITCGTGSSVFVGNSNEQVTWNYLVSRGLTEEQAAGIMGNLKRESEFNPEAVNGGSGATGLAQWLGGRLTRLQDFAAAQEVDWRVLNTQLDFLWFEMTGEEPVEGVTGGYEREAYDDLITRTNVVESAASFAKHFERYEEANDYNGSIPPATGEEAAFEFAFNSAESGTRLDYAQQIFESYAGTSAGGGSSGCASAVGVSGLFFPLITTKSRLAQAPGAWTPEQNGHGQGYFAHDIFEEPDTQVVVYESGRVTTVNERACPPNNRSDGCVGSSVTILGSQSQRLYYYTHMKYNSIVVNSGQEVAAGSPVGLVGESWQAVDTSPHLHIDAVGVKADGSPYTARPTCRRTQLSLCQQHPFVDLRPELRVLYEALPE